MGDLGVLGDVNVALAWAYDWALAWLYVTVLGVLGLAIVAGAAVLVRVTR